MYWPVSFFFIKLLVGKQNINMYYIYLQLFISYLKKLKKTSIYLNEKMYVETFVKIVFMLDLPQNL